MTDTTATPIRSRSGRRVFVLFGLLLLLVAYVGCDAWAGHRVDSEVARFEQVYGSLNEPYSVPVPAADNRARVVRAAAAMIVPNTASNDFSTSFARFTNLTPPALVPADLRAFVETNHVAVRLAAEIGTRQRSDFEGNPLPLLDMRTLSSALYVAAIVDLEAGRADAASMNITSGLAVAASIRQEPELIAQLVRLTVVQPQLGAVQRVITEAEPSKPALAELARWLEEGGTPDPMHTGLLGEVGHVNMTLFDPSGSRPWAAPIARLGRPWIRMARVRYLQQMRRLLEVQSGPRPRPTLSGSPPPPAWAFLDRLAARRVRGLERAIEAGDDFMSEFSATEVAVALRRYRLDRGAYPDDLAALTPAYLQRLPIDAYTGRPPVYSRQGPGFTLRVQAGPHTARAKRPTLEWNVPK